MRRMGRTSFLASAIAIMAALAMIGSGIETVHAQGDITPTNSAPNPYRTVAGWAKLPEGRTLGSTAVWPSIPTGTSGWPNDAGQTSCAGSELPPIFEFDRRAKCCKNSAPGCSCFRTASASIRTATCG